MRLERSQVVVDLLAGQPDAFGEHRRRTWLRELGQQARAHRIECDDRSSRVLDELDVQHGPQRTTDKLLCQRFIARRADLLVVEHVQVRLLAGVERPDLARGDGSLQGRSNAPAVVSAAQR